jgi:hypothetical protein
MNKGLAGDHLPQTQCEGDASTQEDFHYFQRIYWAGARNYAARGFAVHSSRGGSAIYPSQKQYSR